MNMKMPNFLVIGAAKSGTTSLYHWLNQHPQVYMSPIKETNFFAMEGENLDSFNTMNKNVEKYLKHTCKTTLESYLEQFQGVSNEIAIGEVCPMYLYSPKASERIKYYIPDVKLIAILRNPVDRAYSNFLHTIRENYETTDNFAIAIELEKSRIAQGYWWGFYYFKIGLYFKQLKRYFDQFSPNQIKIYLYEDLNSNPIELFQDLCKFLEINPDCTPDIALKYNKTGVSKNKFLQELIKKPNFIKKIIKPMISEDLRRKIANTISSYNLAKPPLEFEVKNQLREKYRDDILKLQNLIQRDLSHWLE